MLDFGSKFSEGATPNQYDWAYSGMVKNSQSRITATLVIPCYNEESRLKPQVFLDYLKSNNHIAFLFVNDGSSDNTRGVIEQMRAICPSRVNILDLKENSGKAEAVRKGLLHASASGSQYVGYWDADLATPLDAIEDFLRVAARLPELEVVYGARKSMLGHRIERKLSRRIVSRTCATLARLAVRLPISDTQCGAKLFKNTDKLTNSLQQQFTSGWLFDVELFSRLANQIDLLSGKFYEYPLVEWTEIPGSKIDSSAVVKSGFIMLKLIGQSRLNFGRIERAKYA